MSDDLDTLDDAEPQEIESKNLSFSDLFPKDHPTFTLPDGSVINFVLQEELDTAGFAEVTSLRKHSSIVLEQLEKNPRDEVALKKFERYSFRFVATILPGMPADVLKKLTLGQRGKIMQFWTAQTGGEQKNADEAS
jgi:hypothetical protein